MLCQIHKQEIKYVCSSDTCYYLPLCSRCHEDHSSAHKHPQIMPISKAIVYAEHNISKQKNLVKELQEPQLARDDLADKVTRQIAELQRQKQRICKQITGLINEQISKLKRQNQIQKRWKDSSFNKQIQKQLSQISQIEQSYRNKPESLQRAMNLQMQKFTEEINKNHQETSPSTQFKLYSSTSHQFILNQLELITANANSTKPIRKVMNESPLYFLINSKTKSTTDYLFNFNNFKQEIDVYSTSDESWSSNHIKDHKFYICSEGFGIHDAVFKRFLYIGGVNKNGRNKSNSILIFNYENNLQSRKWEDRNLMTARSSCMATIVRQKTKEKTQSYGVLIAGGKNNKNDIQKSCEFLNLQTLQITPFSPTNFGAFYGCLVTFNDSTVFRIGGLNKNKNDYSVVQIVEKVECSGWLQGGMKSYELPKWSYIELELPKGDILSKPRLFFANQAAIQINPNEIFVFGGLDSGLRGTTQSYLISIQQFNNCVSRQVRRQVGAKKQQRYCIRWVNQKPLISGDDFRGYHPIVTGQKMLCLQSMSRGDSITSQKRLLQFNMYQWFQTENVLPQ